VTNQHSATTPATGFAALGLIEPLLRSVTAEGYANPTPIQAQAIPYLLAGRDLLGCAQTGTGKTAAFALPMIQRLAQDRRSPVPKCPRALILTPTRELAVQIETSFKTYGRHLGLRHAVVFGGVGQHPQAQAIGRGLDILVATPGRLLDLMNQNLLRLDRLEIFVLDEADRMLDMGFIHDVRRIIKTLPAQRQTLLFSATMPNDIANLANSILRDPATVTVAPVASTAERIDQWVLFVEKGDKRALLGEVLKDDSIKRALVFTRTKHGANRLAEQLDRMGVSSDAIHGNKSQTARQRALADFTAGKLRILVATDIAARGIDIDGITHVINYELPNVPESYVHRIGRTARAGAAGVALSFCDVEEREYLRDIERLIRRSIPVVPDHPFKSTVTELRQKQNKPQQQKPQQQQRGPRRHQRGRGGQRRFG
jgi:ATP-dependent RNA helicase RhlE